MTSCLTHYRQILTVVSHRAQSGLLHLSDLISTCPVPPCLHSSLGGLWSSPTCLLPESLGTCPSLPHCSPHRYHQTHCLPSLKMSLLNKASPHLNNSYPSLLSSLKHLLLRSMLYILWLCFLSACSQKIISIRAGLFSDLLIEHRTSSMNTCFLQNQMKITKMNCKLHNY